MSDDNFTDVHRFSQKRVNAMSCFDGTSPCYCGHEHYNVTRFAEQPLQTPTCNAHVPRRHQMVSSMFLRTVVAKTNDTLQRNDLE